MRYLSKKGTNFELVNTRDRCTPLQGAIKEGHKANIDLLLELGANINGAAGENGYVIHYALESGDESMAMYVLDRGAHLDESLPTHSIMVRAIRCGKLSLLPVLVEKGADISACSPALALSRWSKKDRSVYQWLIDNGARFGQKDKNILPQLIEAGHVDDIKQLLADGMDPESDNTYQTPALVRTLNADLC